MSSNPKYGSFAGGVFLCGLLVVQSFTVSAQEFEKPLKSNPVLTSHHLNKSDEAAYVHRISQSRDTLCLPFFDDFSNPRFWLDSSSVICDDTVYRSNADYYPTNLLWSDSGAFINNQYALNPLTLGVATLDGLNKFGLPYNETTPYGAADTLTSHAIRLGGGFVDSLYLSFYYQAGGLGEPPNTQDSLLLEFRRDDGVWVKQWFSLGLSGPGTQSNFNLVVVPIADPAYWYDGFRFRFRNYATRSGNNDHWNLDYIYLDDNRTVDDTLFRDVSFTVPVASLLSRYAQMPWRQFKGFEASELGEIRDVEVRNNFNVVLNTSFQYEMRETYTGDLIDGPSVPVADGIPAFGNQLFEYPNDPIPLTAPNYEKDSMSVDVLYELGTTSDFNLFNDSMLQRQQFYNYYAHDDGSAERAFGLIGTGAQLAMRYETNQPDTIYAFQIHFAYVDGSLSGLFFSLVVWDDIDTSGSGDGQNVIYQEDFKVPRYVDSLNGFYVYKLEEPVPVDGIFYTGWLQSQSDLLNVGFDKNNDARSNTFFRVGGDWQHSALQGAVMIRPQMGPQYYKYPVVGFNEVNSDPFSSVTLYPNPVSSVIYLKGDPSINNAKINVYAADGRLLKKWEGYNGALDVHDILPGLYLLEIVEPRAGMRKVLAFAKM